MSQNNQFVFKQGNAKNSNFACKFGVEHKSNDYEVISNTVILFSWKNSSDSQHLTADFLLCS